MHGNHFFSVSIVPHDLFNFQKAGCNNVLGANIERDHCGICGGDNTNCHPESGMFYEPVSYGNYFATRSTLLY
jgi:hypothetical protein